MPITWNENERVFPLSTIEIVGLDSGLLDDVKYRPNRYFHPVEEVTINEKECRVLYQKDLSPVKGKISLSQVKDLLCGVIDAEEKTAQDQVFFLYPSVEAFGVDRRRNLRVGLLNARPVRDAERRPQAMSVDAFTDLLASHCPEGYKRVLNHKHNILTLRHLLQVLEARSSSSFWLSLFVLLAVVSGVTGALYMWGPPRIQKAIETKAKASIKWGKSIFRSSSAQWEVGLRKERRKWEYRHSPMSVSLLIRVESATPEQLSVIHKRLVHLLESEFDDQPKARYQLFVPTPKSFPLSYQHRIPLAIRFPKLQEQWKRLCLSMTSAQCPNNAWLLYIKDYRGGFRPLIDAIREVSTKNLKKGKGTLSLKYHLAFGSLTLRWKPKAKPVRKSAPTNTRGAQR